MYIDTCIQNIFILSFTGLECGLCLKRTKEKELRRGSFLAKAIRNDWVEE